MNNVVGRYFVTLLGFGGAEEGSDILEIHAVSDGCYALSGTECPRLIVAGSLDRVTRFVRDSGCFSVVDAEGEAKHRPST